MTRLRPRHSVSSMSSIGLLSASLVACACGAGGAESPPPSTPPPTSPPPPPRYEVHEWGLVRGTLNDHLMISGPHAPEPVQVVTKPLLYFHRLDAGEAPLVVDVQVTIPDGRVVEHWPMTGPVGPTITWAQVTVGRGTCHGSRYPNPGEEPCLSLRDGCEASTLAAVETTDVDCLTWPRPPDDEGPTESWNHLFYRGERDTAAPLPLRLEPQPDGTLRVTSTTTDPIPGRLVRLHHANGLPGASDGITISDPPAPGASIVMGVPSQPMATGAEALGESLSAAGLSAEEVAAFRRAWDVPLFGASAIATRAPSTEASLTTATTTPVMTATPMPIATRSILYVLPVASAERVAELRLTPAPERIQRAIVMWIDEASAP